VAHCSNKASARSVSGSGNHDLIARLASTQTSKHSSPARAFVAELSKKVRRITRGRNPGTYDARVSLNH